MKPAKVGYAEKLIVFIGWIRDRFARAIYSCEIVALQENFVDRPESYDSFRAKSCLFLAYGLGVYFSIPIQDLTKSKVSKYSQDINLLLSYHH
jgi:hypothetical protein